MKTLPANVVSHARDTALNNQGLEAMRKLGRERDPEALREVARQFESMFLQQMMKSMRAAGDVFAEDNFMNSSDTQFYRDMYDQQLTLEMSQGQGIGIAEAFYQQMMQAYGEAVDSPPQTSPRREDLGFTLPERNDAATSVTSTEKVNNRSAAAAESAMSSPQDFVETIKPYVNWAASVLKVNPKAIMAQAVLETGWGEHIIRDKQGASSHNLFNIKASGDWQGDSIGIATTEYENREAKTVDADFRRYDSLFSAFADYVKLLQKPRYQQALAAGNDTAAFAEQLQQAGYATDPAYAQKITAIAEADILTASAPAKAVHSALAYTAEENR